MLDLTDQNRAYLLRRFALAYDEDGLETFVGLTHLESETYQLLSDPQRKNTVQDAAVFLVLDTKHDVALTKAAAWRRDHPA